MAPHSLALDMARLTNAQWIAVSTFEGIIDLPARIAGEPSSGVLGPDSPARYHLLAAAPTIGSVVLATVTCGIRERVALGTALTGTALAGIVTGTLVRFVNIPLLSGTTATDEAPRLVRLWHAGNLARVALLGVAGIALRHAAVRSR